MTLWNVMTLKPLREPNHVDLQEHASYVFGHIRLVPCALNLLPFFVALQGFEP